jgi:hypothetical protein
MRIIKAVSAALVAAIATAAISGSAFAASVPVDLRVVSNDVGNLEDLRQYVPETTTVKTFAGDDCFDPTPPIKQSSGKSYTQSSPTMLGAISEAAQVKRSLQPFRISDADYASFASLSICQISAPSPPGFFFLKANHSGLTVGADRFTLRGSEELIAYRTPADFSADEELELIAPVRAAPGVPVGVNVRAYSGTLGPRAGAIVLGGATPVLSDGQGNATVSFPEPGEYRLVALGDYDDIPSAVLTVCVDPEFESECADARGREILGSDERDGIKGTDGDDVIRPRGGRDRVKSRDGDDRIISKGGGSDRINCGGGKDVVKRDAKDRVARNCEKVKRKKSEKREGGKKRGGGKRR